MSCSHLLMRAGVCPCGYRETDKDIASPIPNTGNPEPDLGTEPEPVEFSAPYEAEDMPLDLPDYVDEIIAEKCRRSLALYVRQAWSQLPHLKNTRLVWNWHHDALCLHLQTMAEEWAVARSAAEGEIVVQRIKNLLINIAPGTTKTLITLVFFPTWMWTRWPDWSCRCVSINPRSILESAFYSRMLAESAWYRANFVPQATKDGELPAWAVTYGLKPWKVRDDQDAKSDWGNTLGGFRRSTGLSAAVVGEHTSWILCDDPMDAAEVFSEDKRENVISKWDNALFNRVNDLRTACRVVVMQRLHALDLSFHILDRTPDAWAHLVIASEFEPQHSKETPIGWHDPRTCPGELLDPIRYPAEELAKEKTRLGTAGYNAQHQQRPDAEGGMMFPASFWRFYTIEGDRPLTPEETKAHRYRGCNQTPPVTMLKRDRWGVLEVDWVCVSVDATFGSTSETASAVGLVIGAGKAAARFILEDLTDGPRSFLQTLTDVESAVRRAVEITNRKQIRVLIEKKANGAACLETLEKSLREGKFENVHGQSAQVVFEAYEPGQNSKDSRAHAMEPDIEGGVLLLHDGAKWLHKYIGEHASFGGAKMRNDRVDATGQLLARYRRKPNWGDAFRAGKR